jgi:hypothetical protein
VSRKEWGKIRSGQLPSRPEPIAKSPLSRMVRVSFEYTAVGSGHCLSGHEKNESQAALRCLQKMTSMTWIDVLQTAGDKKRPTGLHWTPYPDSALKSVRRPETLSRDVKLVASAQPRSSGCSVPTTRTPSTFSGSTNKHGIVPV